MANAKSYMMAKRPTNYRFLTTDPVQTPSHSSIKPTEFEFDESDVWGGSTRSDSPDSRPPPSTSWRQHSRRPMAATRNQAASAASSLPVNIPDWSKILRDEYRSDKWIFIDGGDDVDGEGEEWVPPHEYLSRTRMASFSVHEGIGRTLKGRDLSKVRNAIWEKTGFED